MTIVTQDTYATVFNYDIIAIEKGKKTNVGIYAIKMANSGDDCSKQFKIAEYATFAEATQVMADLEEAVIAGKPLFVMPSL